MKAKENGDKEYRRCIGEIVRYLQAFNLYSQRRYSFCTNTAEKIIKNYELGKEVKEVLVKFKEGKEITEKEFSLLKQENGLTERVED